jgi:hypothetical protein
MNKYKKTKSNNELFDQFALEIVSRMLLFERIKLQSKALYLEAIKEAMSAFRPQAIA